MSTDHVSLYASIQYGRDKRPTIIHLPAMLNHLPDDPSTQLARSASNNDPLLPLSIILLQGSLAERVLVGERGDRGGHLVCLSVRALIGLEGSSDLPGRPLLPLI